MASPPPAPAARPARSPGTSRAEARLGPLRAGPRAGTRARSRAGTRARCQARTRGGGQAQPRARRHPRARCEAGQRARGRREPPGAARGRDPRRACLEEVAERILAPEPPAALVQALERVITPAQAVERVSEPTAASEPTSVAESTSVSEPPGRLDLLPGSARRQRFPSCFAPSGRPSRRSPGSRAGSSPHPRRSWRHWPRSARGRRPATSQTRIYMACDPRAGWTGGMSSMGRARLRLTALGQKHLDPQHGAAAWPRGIRLSRSAEDGPAEEAHAPRR